MKTLKTLLTALLIAILPLGVLAQQELNGAWAGTITQTPRGLSDKYHFALHIQVKGDSLYGVSTIRLIEDGQIYGKQRFTGYVGKDNWIRITEHEIIEENIYSFAYWCIKRLYLKLSYEYHEPVLNGYFNSNNCPGAKGDIRLTKNPT